MCLFVCVRARALDIKTIQAFIRNGWSAGRGKIKVVICIEVNQLEDHVSLRSFFFLQFVRLCLHMLASDIFIPYLVFKYIHKDSNDLLLWCGIGDCHSRAQCTRKSERKMEKANDKVIIEKWHSARIGLTRSCTLRKSLNKNRQHILQCVNSAIKFWFSPTSQSN